MTETTLAVAPAMDAQPTNRRNLLVLGGLVAALALGGGGYVLLSGGSTNDAASGLVSTHHKSAPKVAPAKRTAAAPKAPVVVPAVSIVPLGRDPFRALYLEPVAPPVAVSNPGTTTSTTTSTTTTPVVPKSYALKLTRIYGSGKDLTGVFTISGKSMVAKVGTVFGPTSELKLLSLTQTAKGTWAAAIQVGDSDPVDALQGQTLYVR